MIAEMFAAFRARQTSYSVVCSANALLFLLTAGLHFAWAPPDTSDQLFAAGVALVSAVFVIVPLVMGGRYPRSLGVLGTCFALFGITLIAGWAQSSQMVLNAVLLLPVIAITCGWFFPSKLARPVMLAAVGVLILVLGARSYVVDWPALTLTTLIYIALITGFLFEAGVYLHRQTDRQASHDPLTGALNRFGFWRDGGTELRRAGRSGAAVSVVVIDFDAFKKLNDSRGHLAGDIVLRQATSSWRQGIRPYDLIVRLGGDEFALLLPGADIEYAQSIVERLRAGSDFAWSWGIAQWTAGESLESLLERADEQLLSSRASRQA